MRMFLDAHPNASHYSVMERDAIGTARGAGVAANYFNPDTLARMTIGPSQGSSFKRGAYEWWPLFVGGSPAGELRRDASGTAIHVDEWP